MTAKTSRRSRQILGKSKVSVAFVSPVTAASLRRLLSATVSFPPFVCFLERDCFQRGSTLHPAARTSGFKEQRKRAESEGVTSRPLDFIFFVALRRFFSSPHSQ